jgi:GNAT superfamily N-acetyltransferase
VSSDSSRTAFRRNPSERGDGIVLRYLACLQQERGRGLQLQETDTASQGFAGNGLGGLEGHTYFGWLFIENLAVDESVRKSGWGTKLLEAAHDEARRRGCHHAWLDTFSFQALPFYEKLGYTIFGTLDDFPSSHQRYFLQRAL